MRYWLARLRLWWGSRGPVRDMPHGVVVYLTGGNAVPVEVAFSHRAEGMNHFVVTSSIDPARVLRVTVEYLPARSSVTLRADRVL